MIQRTQPIFIGSAWPYANGSLHIGHASALLPSDVLARFYRARGNPVLYVSGSDCHGTPISVKAEKQKKKPSEIAAFFHNEFRDNFSKLGFSYDWYGATTDAMHIQTVQDIFLALYTSGYIEKRKEFGMFDPKLGRFLPDRYIEGTCPHCSFSPARGDQCDNCGSLLDPDQLVNAKSVLSGVAPVKKETEHFYLLLSKFQEPLLKYIRSIKHIRKNTKSFVDNFLSKGLHDRAITRDLDWGVPIPISGFETKKIYVWFEAVCGYYSMSLQFAKEKGMDIHKFWDDEACAYYVYGKDNIPFHTIIWPSILLAYALGTNKKLHLPDFHVASEYIQIEGKKLSTSRNWAIWIPDLLKDFPQDAIRYALLALGPETSDTNFTFADFEAKINNELVATVGNFIQRSLALCKKTSLKEIGDDVPFASDVEAYFTQIESSLTAAKFKDALTSISNLAAAGNKYLDTAHPWTVLKTDVASARKTIAIAAKTAAQFGILLEPFTPDGAARIRSYFSINKYTWNPSIENMKISPPDTPIFQKIEPELIAAHQEAFIKAKA